MAKMERILTIDQLDAKTFDRLTQEASRRGVAVSILARTLLQQSFGDTPAVFHDLDGLMGTWTEEEAAAFNVATAGMRPIDTELW